MKTLKADLALLAITVFWGASFPIMSISLKYIPPYSFIALRNTTAAILLVLIFSKKFKNMNKKTLIGAFLIGVSLFAGSVFQMVGLTLTTPSKNGFITGLNTVFVPVIIALIYRKFPDRKTVLGIIISIIGLGVMSIDGVSGVNIGDILTMFGAICFSIQILLVDKFSKEADVILLACLEIFVVGILAFIPAFAVEGMNVTFNGVSIFALVFTAVFSTALAMSVQNKMQPMTDPTHAAVIYLAEPVFGAIFSTFIGDRLTGKVLAGCILIFLGMVILNVKLNFSSMETVNEQ